MTGCIWRRSWWKCPLNCWKEWSSPRSHSTGRIEAVFQVVWHLNYQSFQNFNLRLHLLNSLLIVSPYLASHRWAGELLWSRPCYNQMQLSYLFWRREDNVKNFLLSWALCFWNEIACRCLLGLLNHVNSLRYRWFSSGQSGLFHL